MKHSFFKVVATQYDAAHCPSNPSSAYSTLWSMPIPDSSAHGEEWQWTPGCGAVEQSSGYCCTYYRISWKSFQLIHSRYEPGSYPVKKQRRGKKKNKPHMPHWKSKYKPEKMTRYLAHVGTARQDRIRSRKKQKWHYLEFGGDENVVLL